MLNLNRLWSDAPSLSLGGMFYFVAYIASLSFQTVNGVCESMNISLLIYVAYVKLKSRS